MKDRKSRWEVEEYISASIDSAQMILPLVRCLQNTPLKPHHWTKVKSMVLKEFDETSENFTLGLLHESNLSFFANEIKQLADESLKESLVVDGLESIESSWKVITLTSLDGKVISGLPDVISQVRNLFEELKVATKLESCHIYQELIEKLERDLKYGLKILNEIEELQKQWSKWTAFFKCQRTSDLLLQAVLYFDEIKSHWEKLTKEILHEAVVIDIIKVESLSDKLAYTRNSLANISGKLGSYHIEQRREFSRLNFLNDEDLITFMSQIDVKTAPVYLNKLFTNISNIKTQKNASQGYQEIVSIISMEGETVDLSSSVPLVSDFSSCCKILNKNLTNSLKDYFKQCRANFKNAGVKIDELIKAYPLQVVVLALHLAISTELQKSRTKAQAGSDIILTQREVHSRHLLTIQ